MEKLSKPGVEFLSAGGEMATFIRNYDWNPTALGDPSQWPQSLRTAVSLILEAKFPMYIAWGNDFVQFYNDAYRPILGNSKHPAVGISTRETFAEIWDIIGPMFERVMNGEAVGVTDYLLPLHRNGYTEECYFIFSYSPIRGEENEVAGVLVTVTETSERVIEERRLNSLRLMADRAAEVKSEAEAWNQIRLTLEENPFDFPFTLCYSIDEKGMASLLARVRFVEHPSIVPFLDLEMPNEDRILSYVYREGKAKLEDNLSGFLPGLIAGAWPEPITSVYTIPVTLPEHEKPVGALVVGVNPRKEFDEHYEVFCNLFIKHAASAISNARSHEHEKKRSEALMEIDRAKTVFFNNISHEFRTPLTLILGPIEKIISNTGALPEDREDLQTIQRNALRLLSLVNKLLDFSKLETGRVQPHFQQVNLAEYTRDLACSFRSILERADLYLNVSLDEMSGEVWVDREMWEVIVLNLISNAFKYTFKGGIEVNVFPESENVVMEVRDTGVGIPEMELPKIFDRFYRVPGLDGRNHEGSGIGLSLVKELVKIHNGSVSVVSEVGAGTCFRVSIPNGRPDKKDRQTIGGDAPGEVLLFNSSRLGGVAPGEWEDHEMDQTHREGPMPASTILIVDDNADMRRYLYSLLRDTYTVVTAKDGAEALDKISMQNVQLVICDIMMPRMDGAEFLKVMRANTLHSRIPVILISARAGEESRIEGFNLGADDYVIKPFSSQELLARVNAQVALQRKRLHAEKQWRSLFLHAPVAIAIFTGKDHVVDLVNERMLELWGRTYVQVIGKPVFEGVSEARGQGLEEMLHRALEEGERVVTEERVVSLNRKGKTETIFVKFVLEPLRDEEGKISGVMALADEITFLVTERERALNLVEAYEKRATEGTLSLKRASQELQRSEDRYHRMIEEVQDYAIFMLGVDGEVMNWNKGAEKIKGYKEEEIVGKNFRMFYLAEDRENGLPESLIDEARKNGRASHYGWRLRKNGSKFWSNTVITALHDENNKVIGFTKVTRDLTEKKVADDILRLNSKLLEEKNAELLQQKDFRDTILESTIDIIVVYDREYRFLAFNKQAEIKYGLKKEQVLGKKLFDLFPKARGSKGLQDLERSLNGEMVHNLQYRSEITSLWYEDYLIPLKTPQDEVYAVLVIAHDITESITSHEQLKKMNDDLRRSNHDLEHFAYIASHDLQEPLRKIRTFSDILHQKLARTSGDHQYYFNKIQQSAQRMSELINAVLNYSKISRRDDHFEQVDLNQTLENVKFDYELMIAEKKAVIKSEPLPIVRGISLQLNQLFANLIHNALKFSVEAPLITIGARSVLGKDGADELVPELRYVELTFRDNGIGFDQQYAEKIFTIFQRLHSRERYAGTGIGLALCKKVVENHQGTILVQSQYKKGSLFTIYLPEGVAIKENNIREYP